MPDTLDPHPDLTAALHEAYGRALREAKYRAPYFLELLEGRYGYETAIHLVGSTQPSLGFTNLWERKRLDLTVERGLRAPRVNQQAAINILDSSNNPVGSSEVRVFDPFPAFYRERQDKFHHRALLSAGGVV